MPFALRVKTANRTAGNAGGTATITIQFDGGHPFKVGDKVNLYGLATTAGTIGFYQGNPYTVATVSGTAKSLIGGVWTVSGYSQLTLSQTVPANYTPAADGANTLAIASGTVINGSRNYFQVTTTVPHNLGPVGARVNTGLTGVTGLSAIDLGKINGGWQMPQSTVVDASTLAYTIKGVQSWTGVVWTGGSVLIPPTSGVIVSADSINAVSGVAGASGVNSNWSAVRRGLIESDAVFAVQQMVMNFTALDYPLLRFCSFYDTSKINATRVVTSVSIAQPPSSWRSVLDALVETYGGADGKKRRYWIDGDGIFNWAILDDGKPATANAPYKISTTGPWSPNSTTDPVIAPFNLQVSWDHDTTKRALFSTSNGNGQPISDFIRYDSLDALGTAVTRSGAPVFDDLVEYPTGTSDKVISRQTGARAYFLDRAAPILSGKFTVRGAGTASHNRLGFGSGYATISSSTSITLPLRGAYTSGGTNREVTATDYANIVAGMQVVVSGFLNNFYSLGTAFNGTYTITDVGKEHLTSWDTGLPFQYTGGTSLPGIAGPFYATDSGFAQAVISGLFVRTGSAPNQIVTVTLPVRHNLLSGASSIVSGLTGTAGTSMNGTVTITRVDDYSFIYPSTGTNGTAGGSAALSSVSPVSNWQPGQWVDITAPDQGLSGLYRIEQVDWRLEPGSFQSLYDITFNRRSAKPLTQILKEVTK